MTKNVIRECGKSKIRLHSSTSWHQQNRRRADHADSEVINFWNPEVRATAAFKSQRHSNIDHQSIRRQSLAMNFNIAGQNDLNSF